ncbi:MAG: hypothetical protein PHS09_04600 [Candidatus Omnitrophica bacterium]|nr:hypothetical protein [Candidatus Omnitrophota bacterium]MDD5513259.1 hypothetical protein [Candidatus Omnitrophota bacterium]
MIEWFCNSLKEQGGEKVTRLLRIFAVLFLISFCQQASRQAWAQQGASAVVRSAVKNAETLADEFSEIAMKKFESLGDSQLSYPIISSRVRDYALKMFQLLVQADLPAASIETIKNSAAAWYGEALESIFKGRNMDQAAQQYSRDISELFSQEHLGIDLQSQLVSQASLSFEEMESFFQDTLSFSGDMER